MQNWETIQDIIQHISQEKSHWKEQTVCLGTCETSWETRCRRSVMQQVCWSKSGTNNRECLCLPPASCMRDILRETTALVSAAQLALKGLGVEGRCVKASRHFNYTPEAGTQISLFLHIAICQRCHIRHDEWEREQSETEEADSLSVAAHNHRCISEVRATLNLWVWMKLKMMLKKSRRKRSAIIYRPRAPPAMSRQRLKDNFEAISCKVNLGQMSSDTWGIRCHVRGAGCRKACGERKLCDVKGGGKRGEIKLVSAHFGIDGPLCSTPVSGNLCEADRAVPEPPVAPPARSLRGNWIRVGTVFSRGLGRTRSQSVTGANTHAWTQHTPCETDSDSNQSERVASDTSN